MEARYIIPICVPTFALDSPLRSHPIPGFKPGAIDALLASVTVINNTTLGN